MSAKSAPGLRKGKTPRSEICQKVGFDSSTCRPPRATSSVASSRTRRSGSSGPARSSPRPRSTHVPRPPTTSTSVTPASPTSAASSSNSAATTSRLRIGRVAPGRNGASARCRCMRPESRERPSPLRGPLHLLWRAARSASNGPFCTPARNAVPHSVSLRRDTRTPRPTERGRVRLCNTCRRNRRAVPCRSMDRSVHASACPRGSTRVTDHERGHPWHEPARKREEAAPVGGNRCRLDIGGLGGIRTVAAGNESSGNYCTP